MWLSVNLRCYQFEKKWNHQRLEKTCASKSWRGSEKNLTCKSGKIGSVKKSKNKEGKEDKHVTNVGEGKKLFLNDISLWIMILIWTTKLWVNGWMDGWRALRFNVHKWRRISCSHPMLVVNLSIHRYWSASNNASQAEKGKKTKLIKFMETKVMTIESQIVIRLDEWLPFDEGFESPDDDREKTRKVFSSSTHQFGESSRLVQCQSW